MSENCNSQNFGGDIVAKQLREITEAMNKCYAEHKEEIDAEVRRYKRKLKSLQKGMPKILVGDIVRINSIHSSKLSCYEVSSIREDGVVSQPAGFHHRYDEIIAVYRFDETDFKCIWERKDYVEYKNS